MSPKQRFYKRRLFWVVFGIPNIISLLYFAVIATPQYVSEARLVVYQSDQGTAEKSINLQLSQNAGGMSLEGDYLLKSYLSSWDCFARLDRKALVNGWTSGDFVSRFGGLLNAFRSTPTVLWRYYQHRVTATIDEQSAIVTVRVVGYDPAFVKTLSDAALQTSGRAINTLNEQAFSNAEAFFESQIIKDQSKLRGDISRLSAFQQSSRIMDPSAAYTAQLDLLNQLNSKLAALSAQVDMVRASTPGSDQLQNLITERQSLEQKIKDLQTQVSGRSSALTGVVGNYTFLQSLIKNDQDSLSADEEQLLHSHQAALQHQYFIEYVGYPTTPINPTEPKRLISTLIFLMATAFLYVIIK